MQNNAEICWTMQDDVETYRNKRTSRTIRNYSEDIRNVAKVSRIV